MNGVGLNFNSPGVVRIQKSFGVAFDPAFDWMLVDSVYNVQNTITYFANVGPALLPFCCFVRADTIDIGTAGFLYIKYFTNSAVAVSALFSIPFFGSISSICNNTYPLERSNLQDNNDTWPTTTGQASGICIAADAPFNSGVSLTVTLFCVNTGLSY